MSGGGKSTQTSTSMPVLPPRLNWALDDLTREASDTYHDARWEPGYVSQYAPMSQATQMGAGLLAQRGLAGQPLVDEATQALGGVLGSTPVAGMGSLEGLARGENSITAPGSNPFTGGIAAMAQQNNPYGEQIAGLAPTDLISRTAAGEMIGSNPHLDQTFNRAAEQVGTATRNMLNTRGLAGIAPGIETNVLSRNLSDMAADMYGRAYSEDMSRALSAGQYTGDFAARNLGTAAGLTEAGLGRGLAGLGAAAGLAGQDIDRGIGVQQQNIANMLGATGMLGNLQSQQFGNQLAGIGALGSLQGYANQDIANLLASGAITDADTQARLADQAAQAEFGRQRPWELLNMYAQALGMAGPMQIGQTSTGTSKTSGGIPGLGLLNWAFPNGLFGGGGEEGG